MKMEDKISNFKSPIRLVRLSDEHTIAFKEEMQDAGTVRPGGRAVQV